MSLLALIRQKRLVREIDRTTKLAEDYPCYSLQTQDGDELRRLLTIYLNVANRYVQALKQCQQTQISTYKHAYEAARYSLLAHLKVLDHEGK